MIYPLSKQEPFFRDISSGIAAFLSYENNLLFALTVTRASGRACTWDFYLSQRSCLSETITYETHLA